MIKHGGSVTRCDVEDVESEIKRYVTARESVAEELEGLQEKAKNEIGESGAMIFEIHRMMLYDDDFDKSVISIIKWQGVNAEYAVTATADNLARIFSDMTGDYMKARAADVRDVAKRLTDALEGRGHSLSLSHPCIIAAEDLTPGETVNLDKKLALGFITEGGTDSSHSAILARTMGIPAVVSAGKIDMSLNGKSCIIDGEEGVLYIEPDEDTRSRLMEKKRAFEEEKRSLESLRGRLTATKDGRRIKVYANIGEPSDVRYAIEGDAEGVGLFRSEFLYMKYGRPPTEDEQFEAYRQAGEAMGKKELIVRTLDCGADKKIPYLGLREETNPALGLRAVRLCLKREDIFLTQLRALYRATAYTGISIMFPMIVSPDEIIKAKGLCRTATEQLKKEGIPFVENTKIGIMIETPAAAVCADLLAPHVDFFSIGTNDLTQYTVAADRENSDVSYLTEEKNTAVLRLIAHVARCAEREGIWAGVCGEMGSDTSLTEFFVRVGIKELSVTPSKVLEVRRAVMESREDFDISAFLRTGTEEYFI